MKNLTKLYDLFLNEEKKRIIVLTILIIINALIETIGIASIFPFLAILTNPEIIETNFFLNLLYAKILNFKIITLKEIYIIISSFIIIKSTIFNYHIGFVKCNCTR